MDEVAILEVLRQQLKEHIDKLIDDAISRVKDTMAHTKDIQLKQQPNELKMNDNKQSATTMEQPKKIKDLVDIISEDSGSLVLDYSPLQVQAASQNISSQITEQTQSNEDDLQISQPDTFLIKNQFPSELSIHSKTESLISPVLNQATRRGIKRDKHNQKQDAEHDLTERLFSRNVSCTTPIKPKSKKAKQAKTMPLNSTPPHFWSLDMPSSPVI